MAPKRVDTETKKKVIIKAAIKEFAKHGLTNAKIIDIAVTAGIGKGTVYEYFGSKEEIFYTALENSFEELLSQLNTIKNENCEPDEKLKNLIKSYCLSLQKNGTNEIIYHFWAEGLRIGNRKIKFLIKKTYKEGKEIISSILEDGISKGYFKKKNSHNFATILTATLDGLILQATYGDKINFEEIYKEIQIIIEAYLNID